MKKILLLLFLMTVLMTAAASARDNVEQQKIECLISSVQNLKGTKFIRNGSEYDGTSAAKHLRLKLEKAGSRIKTADDFIKLCASQSFVTGQPYRIKFSDGKTVSSEKFFHEKLRHCNLNFK